MIRVSQVTPNLNGTSLSMSKGRLLAGLTLFSAVALTASACGGSSSSSSPSASAAGAGTNFTLTAPAAIKSAGVLSICADMTYPPYTFVQNNEPTGEDVDFANVIAKAMGVQAQFHQTGYVDIVGALQAGKCDVIINGTNGTAALAEVILQDPYLRDTQGFITQKGNPEHIQSLDDLAGKRVATQLGSSDATYLQALNKTFVAAGKAPMVLAALPQDTTAFSAVLSGRYDTFFQDRPVLGYYATNFPGQVTILDLSVNPVSVVVDLRKDETALAAVIQTGIADMYRLGIFQKIAAKWGFPASDLLSSACQVPNPSDSCSQ
ncbi:MAG TPA: transporter substrate-binding domain-containing protein [Candidatus Saccharimonadales bacterium]|nr:transporter substrate-binding domain-containing protein [Candidatus Saccharimonadales bacterium]